MSVSLTACVEAATPVDRNPNEACNAEAQWGLADTLGVEGHDSPEEAAAYIGRERADLPDGPWYVVREEGDEALLSTSQSPWRVEAARIEDLGWVITSGLLCVS